MVTWTLHLTARNQPICNITPWIEPHEHCHDRAPPSPIFFPTFNAMTDQQSTPTGRQGTERYPGRNLGEPASPNNHPPSTAEAELAKCLQLVPFVQYAPGALPNTAGFTANTHGQNRALAMGPAPRSPNPPGNQNLARRQQITRAIHRRSPQVPSPSCTTKQCFREVIRYTQQHYY